jgi:hypothetical protein
MKAKVDAWLCKLTDDLSPLVKRQEPASGKAGGASGSVVGFGITTGPGATPLSSAASVERFNMIPTYLWVAQCRSVLHVRIRGLITPGI